MQKTSLWKLFITFFKIGAFTFGGGYAMLPILEHEVVERYKWLTPADMLDMIVIAEATPGVIAVNSATSVGYRTRGLAGALIATLGVVLPSFCIIIALSFAIDLVADNIWYQSAFAGVQVAVLVLITRAFVKVSGQLNRSPLTFVLLIVAVLVATFTNVNVIYLIICGGVVGIILTLINNKKFREPLPLESDQNPINENSALADPALEVDDSDKEVE